jgi:hypothetical protein
VSQTRLALALTSALAAVTSTSAIWSGGEQAK